MAIGKRTKNFTVKSHGEEREGFEMGKVFSKVIDVREINLQEYKKFDIFPTKTKKEINDYREIDILYAKPWELYRYFIATENEVRRIIKKRQDACMITTFDKTGQSHIDIIYYDKNGIILELIRIDSRKDGFVYRSQKISSEDAIILYEKHGNSFIKVAFSPSDIDIKYPKIEVEEKPDHLVRYLIKGQSPIEVSLYTNYFHTVYVRDKDGLYSLEDANPITKLIYFLTSSKSATLEEVEKKLKVTYPLNDRLLSILQEAMYGYDGERQQNRWSKKNGLNCPEELNAVLHYVIMEEMGKEEGIKGGVVGKGHKEIIYR